MHKLLISVALVISFSLALSACWLVVSPPEAEVRAEVAAYQ
jgi:hypothetical protein